MRKLIALLLAVAMVFGMTAAASATEAEATYTYNSATGVFPTNWSPFISTSTADGEIGGYMSAGFYAFDYNETGDGWAYVPSVAVDYPEDVTADYIGQYGLEEGDEYRAWKVTIRDDLKWDDGTAITAYDYVESLKRLLDPAAQNYAADAAYAGNVIIHNAENYLKAGQSAMENNYNGTTGTMTYAIADLVKGEDGAYTTPDGSKVYIGLNQALDWIWGYTLTDYYGWGYFPDEGCWDVLSAAADEDGWVPVTDETIAAVHVATGADAWGGETEEQVAVYFTYESTYGETAWEDVGIFALSDYELVYVLDAPLKGFYLYYNLPCYLVKLDLYDSLAAVTDGVYTNTYGTSAETSASYGPYKLVSFQKDKQYVLERNEYYFGFTDDTYQTTSIVVDYVPESSTQLELFLQGKLDEYSLTADNMDTYGLSDYCYYYETYQTIGIILNPDYDGLVEAQEAAGENINKTILTLVEFRQALSYALDRSGYNLATTPLYSVGIALYNDLSVADPETATSYRSTDAAKQVLAEFWGVSEDYGEGKLYADIDEALDSITGYNLEKAQELFDIAYDKAIEQGLMDEDDVVQITIGLNSNSVTDINGYEFLVNCYTEAVKGTKLEGKLTFVQDDTVCTSDEAWQTAIRNNQIDLEFKVGWNGTALDPYNLMVAYVSQSYQWDDCLDYSAVDMTLTIDGVDYTTSVYDWYLIMMGTETEITAADGSTMLYSCGATEGDPETRVEILAALEGAVLMNYDFIPTSNYASASLKGQQVNYKTEEEIFIMEYGGIKYFTYNYTDAEWDAYVAENGGELDYT